MKKFVFPLDKVLDYKNQILEELKREHGIITANIAQQEDKINNMEQEYRAVNDKFNEKNEQGISAIDAMNYKLHIQVMQGHIKEEYGKLDKLKKEEEEKQKEVVKAKVEVSSFEKLKEKHIEEYNKIVLKEEELFIEEFVSNKRATASRS